MPYIVLNPSAAQAAPSTTIGNPLTSTGYTLASFRAALSVMLGGRDDIATSVIDQAINDSYVDIATSTKGRTGSLAISTTAGQPLYLLPSAVSSIQSVVLTDSTLPDGGLRLDKRDKEYYRSKPVVDNEAPTMYFREGNLLVLYPTPDAAYVLAIDFRIRPAFLVATTDSPILDIEWHEAIKLGARHKLMDALEEFDKTPQTNNSFVDIVRRRDDNEADETENKLIRSSVPHRDPRYIGYGNRLYRARDY